MSSDGKGRAPRQRRSERDRQVAAGVVPLVVSQLNVTAAFGIGERRYREIARDLPHRREGHLIFVDASVLRAALIDEAQIVDLEAEDKPLSRVDELRAAAGLRVVR